MHVPPGDGAALHLADGDGGVDGLRRLDRPPVAAAAVTAVGGDGQRQQRQGQDAENDLFEPHGR